MICGKFDLSPFYIVIVFTYIKFTLNMQYKENFKISKTLAVLIK